MTELGPNWDQIKQLLFSVGNIIMFYINEIHDKNRTKKRFQ